MKTNGIFKALLITALIAVVFSCEKGSPTIELIEPEIKWENPEDIVYGTALSRKELNARANTRGTYTYTPELGTVLKGGNEQELKVTFTPRYDDKYKPVTKTVVINVLKIDPVITWQQPMDMFYYINDPEPLTEKQLNATANTDGKMNYVGLVSGASVLLPGKRELQVQFVPDDTDSYNTVTKSVKVHVSESAGTVTDVDGNKYHTVQIGEQVWMAENLKTTKYNDGTEIPLSDGSFSDTPVYCWPDPEESDEITYKEEVGLMYNWHVVSTKKLCPSGWHVPSLQEWQIMTRYLFDSGYSYNSEYKADYPSVANALAATIWQMPEYYDTGKGIVGDQSEPERVNASGLSFVPSKNGLGSTSSEEFYEKFYASFWTATKAPPGNERFGYQMYNIKPWLLRIRTKPSFCFSIRCIKD